MNKYFKELFYPLQLLFNEFRSFILGIRDFVKQLLILLFILNMVARLTYIPSGSMTPTLMVGDKVVISMVHFGPKIPQTLFQLPILPSMFEGKYYLKRGPQLPFFRFPGVSTLKSGDCVVFNTPVEVKDNEDMRPFWVKRIIGMPGDRLRIDEGIPYINGARFVLPPKVKIQRKYSITLQGFRYQSKEEKYLTQRLGISEVKPTGTEHTYHILVTPERSEELKGYKEVANIELFLKKSNQKEGKKYFQYDDKDKFAECLGGNEDYLLEITIPKAGMTIEVTQDNLCIYGHLIVHHEGHQEVYIDAKKGHLMIDNKQCTTYTFLNNYYYVRGDNTKNSYDSSGWGFLSEKLIVGKPILILWSTKNNSLLDYFTFQFNWGRFLKPVV